MKEVVIVSAARTPFGKFVGALRSLKATDLGGLAIKEALQLQLVTPSALPAPVFG